MVAVDSLLIVTSIVGFCNCSMFCCAFKFCTHLDGEEREREMVALLSLSSWSLVTVCLRFVIVVFPNQTHLLFLECSKLH